MILRHVAVFLLLIAPLRAQSGPALVGLGDSLGEGDQSVNASTVTQPNSYLNLIARQMGVPFPLPLIQSGFLGVVGSTLGRSRVDPSVGAFNLAVSGADVRSLLMDVSQPPIDSETDLVLSPRSGSQISIAERLRAPFMICWIGNNDSLGAVVSNWNHLDGSQTTPVDQFAADYDQIVQRLSALGGKVVLGNLPNVTQIAFLFGPGDLEAFLGGNFGLARGSYTTLPVMLLLRLGLSDGSILQDPNFVLDQGEARTIGRAVQAFNIIIASEAANAGMAVADINTMFNEVAQNPPVINGMAITNRFLGGIFSLDAVHPSNVGYAVVANAFIRAANAQLKMNIPPISHVDLLKIALADPFIDWDQDLKVRGRPFTGLLETFGVFMGISGDRPNPRPGPGVFPEMGQRFMREYFTVRGMDPNTRWTPQDAIDAMRFIFPTR